MFVLCTDVIYNKKKVILNYFLNIEKSLISE